MDILSFWYQVMIASEPLLEDAIHLLSDEGFEGELKAFYRHHLEDERNHATWMREDMGDAPINLHLGAAMLAGTQYYLIRHIHPVCLMGYMMELEGHDMDMSVVEEIESRHGKQAGRTLRLHAESEPDHIKELRAFPIPDEFMPMVKMSQEQTQRILRGL